MFTSNPILQLFSRKYPVVLAYTLTLTLVRAAHDNKLQNRSLVYK